MVQDMNLEHVNINVTDPRRTAGLLERVFDWHTRWHGPAMLDGETVHVGTDDTYIALYTRPEVADVPHHNGHDRPGLAHIGILVDDLDSIEQRVTEEGIEAFNHNDTAPGRRFYFFDHDEICYEVASYA
jgi:catechol 2,3-dioxygenase-like lactoylglutathione lyase family enzyme